MSKDFSRIKHALSMSTTLPAGTGGAPGWLEHGLPHSHHHEHHHHHDGCCGHDHADHHEHHHDESCGQGHKTEEKKVVQAAPETEDFDDEDCDGDHTSPRGGCGCC